MTDDKEAAKGLRALVVSFVLGVVALGGAAIAFAVPERAIPLVLALSACVAFAALIAAFVSFRGGRTGPSIAAALASLLILTGVAVAFGGVSVKGFVDAVERNQPRRAEHVDDDYRFRLHAPTYDAFIYDARAVRSMNDQAIAGMWIPDEEMTVLVFVEQRYGRSLAQAAPQELRLAIGGAAEFEGTPERVRYLGKNAIRIHRGFARDDEATLWTESTFFVHQGFVYHLYASCQKYERPEGDAWFPMALDAFTLERGEVRVRFTPGFVEADDGPEWRVRDAVYEDAAWGVRVDGAGYELAYGTEVEAWDDAAIVTIARSSPDVYLTVRPSTVGGRDPIAVGHELTDSFEAQPNGREARELDMRGRSLWFLGRKERIDREWHYRYGVWVDDERAIELIAWAPTPELVDEHLPEMLSRVEILDAAATERLRRELGDGARSWHDVGRDWSLRGDLFVDHVASIGWRRPDGRWRAFPSFESVEEWNEFVHFEAPALGLSGRIEEDFASEGEPLLEAHREWLETTYPAVVDQIESARPITIDGRAALLSERLDYDPEYAAALVTVEDPNAPVHVEVFGTRRDFERNREQVRAALEGITFVDEEPETPEVLRDTRMGYAIRRPWPGDAGYRWDTLDDDVGTFAEFRDDIELVGVFAVRRDPTVTVAEQRDALVDYFYGWLLQAAGEWTERPARLGGRAGTLRERRIPFGLGGTAIYALESDGIVYVLVIEHRNGITPREIARGFSLVR